jgi:hypothetical protein
MRTHVASQRKNVPAKWGGSEQRIGVTKQDRDTIAQAVVAAMLHDPTAGISGAAKAVGVSRSTLYRLMDSDREMREQIVSARVCFRGAGSLIADLLGEDLAPRRQPRAPLSFNGRRAALANLRQAQAEAAKLERATFVPPSECAPKTEPEPRLAECDDSDFWRKIFGPRGIGRS